MSYHFGRKSRSKLDMLDEEMVLVCEDAIQIIDFTIIYTHRGQDLQDELYARGVSKVKFPKSKHNKYPSLAFDFAPWPIQWPDYQWLRQKIDEREYDAIQIYTKATARFYAVAGVIRACANKRGIPIRWGGDWDGDWDFFDQTFDDLGHIEKR